MGEFAMLQNRALPWDQDSRVVYSWPLDEPERYCTADDYFADSAQRVIVVGTGRCSLHSLAEQPCLASERVPAECPHERLDPAADPAAPRCLTCGRVGSDVSDRRLRADAAPGGPTESALDDPSSANVPEAS